MHQLNHVEVFLFQRPPKEGMATGRFFRVQVKHGVHGSYMDVDAEAPKLRTQIQLAAGAVAERMQENQADKKGGCFTKSPIDPHGCSRAAGTAFDELVAENPVIRENPFALL